MFSGLIPGLNSVYSPEDELSARIPASLITLLDLAKQFTHGLAFFLRELSDFGVRLEWHTLVLWSGVLITIALIAWSHYSEDEGKHGSDSVPPLDGDLPEPDAEAAALLGSTHLFKDEDELSNKIPASLIALLDLPKQLLSLRAHSQTDASLFTRGLAFFRREWSDIGIPLEWRTLVRWSVNVGIVFKTALIAWSRYSEEEVKHGSNTVARLEGESPEPNAGAAVLGSFHLFKDALFNANGEEIVPESDLQYAEELQVQEALLASLLSSRMADNPVSPAILTSPMLIGEPSQSFCDICFEEKESWQMFRNKTCSHSFCYDCTSKHIVAKIQANIKNILCPGVDCKALLDFNACRTIIPNDALVQWDESLCKSLIPESQKVYCPFRDCSAMLVNDSEEVIKEIECPACHRPICAWCRVPWHLEFTCEEFQRLNAKKKGKDDVLVKELAKKKSWRKCPHCKFYVEKTEGCIHITCRCGYEFCYGCGSKWTTCHGGCSLRP